MALHRAAAREVEVSIAEVIVAPAAASPWPGAGPPAPRPQLRQGDWGLGTALLQKGQTLLLMGMGRHRRMPQRQNTLLRQATSLRFSLLLGYRPPE